MKPTSFISSVIAVATGLASLTFAAPIVQKRADCPSIEFVFAAGTSEKGMGMVGPAVLKQLQSLVPGSRAYPVNYPTNPEYSSTVQQGAKDSAQHIASISAACPSTKFALGGYSKGGMVVHNTKLSATDKSKVIAVVLFGDPLRKQGAAGVPIDDPKGIDSHCNKGGDPICLNGSNFMAHMAYTRDGSAAKAGAFIADRFKAAPAQATPGQPAAAAAGQAPPPQ